jgi:hypothetical protein
MGAPIRSTRQIRLTSSLRFSHAVAGSFLALNLSMPLVAFAQTRGPLLDTEIPLAVPSVRNKTVVDRPHPELAPQGIGAGGFRLFPEISIEPGFSSNALASNVGSRGDAFISAQPRLRAVSQWSRHALNLSADLVAKRYATVSAKNENGFLARADGRLDLYNESNIAAAFGFERTFEEQYTGSFPVNGGASIAVRHPVASVRGTFVANRLRLIASSAFDRFDYSDTTTLGGAPLDQDYRDRKVYRISGRVEYLFAADSAAFIQATQRRTRYDDRSNALTDRSSKEIRIIAGLVTDVTPIIRAAFGVGYADRQYGHSGIPPVRDVVADLRVDYNVTQLSTFSLVGSRGIEEAIVPNAAGYVASKIGLRVDHELLRNLMVNAGIDYQHDDFKGIARLDSLIRISAGAAYTMSRNVVITPALDYVRRRSNGAFAGPNFKEVRFVMRASLRF